MYGNVSVMDIIQNLLDGSAQAQAYFMLIAVAGMLLLLVGVILDGVFDFLDGAFDSLSGGDGPLSIQSLGAFLGLFGAAGAISINAGRSVTVSALIGVLCGLIAAAATWLLIRNMKNDKDSEVPKMNAIVGSEARVIERVPAERKLSGVITLSWGGTSNNYSAKSDVECLVGDTVIIVDALSTSLMLVEKKNLIPAEPKTEL